MSTKSNQREKVLALLQSGKSLTQAQGRQRGIQSLSSRVNELRRQDVPITSERFTKKVDGKKFSFVRYTLSRTGR